MIHNENPQDSVVQIYDIKPFNNNGEKRICAVVSDGINLHSFCVLAPNLNELIFSGQLESFSIVKITNYIITNVIVCFGCKKILTIKDLVILMPGNIASLLIGNPQPITPLFYQNMEHGRLINLRDIANLLTKGSLMSIMNNEDLTNPVLQVFDFRSLTKTRGIYHITISDGDHSTSITALNTMAKKIMLGQLSEFSAIVLTKYIVNHFFYYPARPVKCLTIIDFEILVCGHAVVSKIGNPQQIDENVWDTVGDAPCDALNMIECFDNLNLN